MLHSDQTDKNIYSEIFCETKLRKLFCSTVKSFQLVNGCTDGGNVYQTSSEPSALFYLRRWLQLFHENTASPHIMIPPQIGLSSPVTLTNLVNIRSVLIPWYFHSSVPKFVSITGLYIILYKLNRVRFVMAAEK
jgi:hypothetical protein